MAAADGLVVRMVSLLHHPTSLTLSQVATLLLTVILILLTVWHFSNTNRLIKKLPGPKPVLPLLGSILLIPHDVTRILGTLMGYARRFPGIFHLRIGADYVVVHSPEAAEQIFTSIKHINKGAAYDHIHPWLNQGLLTSSGAKWQKRRKMLTPAFHFSILDQFMDVFNEQAAVLVSKLRDTNAEKIDLFPFIARASLDIICEATMGVRLEAQKGMRSDYVQTVHDMGNIVFMRFLQPWLTNESVYRWTAMYRRQEKYLKLLHGFTDSVINRRREELVAESTDKEVDSDSKKKGLAFLDLLLKSTIEGQPLSHADIREEVDTFMFEGHDTTSSGVNWTLYNLGRFPEIQARAYAELKDVLGEDDTVPISRTQLSQLRYLEMVVKESLRLFPPVPFIVRRLGSDINLNGYDVPGQCMITLFLYGIHRDPHHWPDPEKFDPERFTPQQSQGRHPFAFVPFSAGPRNCIGQKFAMMEEKTVIASVLRAFEVKSYDKYEDLRITGDIVLRLDGNLWLSFTPRR